MNTASVIRPFVLRVYRLDQCCPNLLFMGPFRLLKITTDPHILADVTTAFLDDRYSKLKIYISELILDG